MVSTAVQKGFPLSDETGAHEDAPGKYPISSVDNALRVLLLFREASELRLSDVAEAVGVSPSTAHRLLAALVRHDFVRQRGERGAYIAGPALLEIGYGAVRSLDLRGLAEPILTHLAESIDETVHLAQLEGGQIRYLAGAESSQYLRCALRTGQLFPAHLTATGRAILSGLTPPQLAELLGGVVNEEGKPLSRAEAKAVEARLQAVREAGYAINHRPDGVVSLAVSVRNRRGLTVAAINASAPGSRMGPERVPVIIAALQSAADELAAALEAA